MNPKMLWVVLCICACIVAIIGYGLVKNEWAVEKTIVKSGKQDNSCSVDEIDGPLVRETSTISMLDSTDLLGPSVPSKTFSLAVSDVNKDGRDDILIGAHEMNPYLYINNGSGFSDQSRKLFQPGVRTDRHGYTFADLDNDGDLDLAIAGGGDDGVGKGAPNIFFRNNTINGEVSFSEIAADADMELQAGRGRALIPVASPDGKAVDLYYAALARDGFPNVLLRNKRQANKIAFSPDAQHFLTKPINDSGHGVIADLDGDGESDYLVIEDAVARIYWNPLANRIPSNLADRANTANVSDFNNDGRLDVFIGRFSLPTQSDRVTYDTDALIYVINKNERGDAKSMSFRTNDESLALNLNQHIPATDPARRIGTSSVYIGKSKQSPKNRIFVTNRHEAEGEPLSFSEAGIYIWYLPASGKWNIKWVFFDLLKSYKGIVQSKGIEDVLTRDFNSGEPELVSDVVLINSGNGKFSKLCTPGMAHRKITSGVTVADFNNDGWLDVIGVRRGQEGDENNGIFILENKFGASFSAKQIGPRDIDRLHSSDRIAYGFFNADSLPDIVMTNGYGQIPGTNGSPRLMLNNTPVQYPAILIDLEGTSANKYAIGAKLTLTDGTGRVIGYREHGLNMNVSMNSQRQSFGLGNNRAPYHLQIDWPDSVTTNHTFSEPGTYRIVQQPH